MPGGGDRFRLFWRGGGLLWRRPLDAREFRRGVTGGRRFCRLRESGVRRAKQQRHRTGEKKNAFEVACHVLILRRARMSCSTNPELNACRRYDGRFRFNPRLAVTQPYLDYGAIEIRRGEVRAIETRRAPRADEGMPFPSSGAAVRRTAATATMVARRLRPCSPKR